MVPDADDTEGIRLQRVLAQRGWGSRRVCEELIEAGRVTVNGEVAQLGRRVVPEVDLVAVDGAPVGTRPGLVYYLLNKPVGVVSTAKDTHGRPTVVDLVPGEPRVYPVGRLDADSEGLLLLTNDGDLANRVAHPSNGVDKEYLVDVEVRRRRRRRQGRRRCDPAVAHRHRVGRAAHGARACPSRAPACCASSSTRVATARCVACAMPSGIPSGGSCAPASGRCATSGWHRGSGGRSHPTS
ncbi:MAG: pseudouridine synthase [Ilumatobacteraceae bacterium]